MLRILVQSIADPATAGLSLSEGFERVVECGWDRCGDGFGSGASQAGELLLAARNELLTSGCLPPVFVTESETALRGFF